MMNQVWRLTEGGNDNLGFACTEDGLMLGRTLLIERRGREFIVREQRDIERLLSRAYRTTLTAGHLMPRLASVAAALNGNDPALARFAAVHLRLRDLPDQAARDGMEAEDRLIKSGDWKPDLHPRAGTPPNPGWFAPTGSPDGEAEPIRTAQNEMPNQASDASRDFKDDWARFSRPAQRVDELSDFAEWLANATPQDEQAIRAEIKRYFEDVGWDGAAISTAN